MVWSQFWSHFFIEGISCACSKYSPGECFQGRDGTKAHGAPLLGGSVVRGLSNSDFFNRVYNGHVQFTLIAGYVGFQGKFLFTHTCRSGTTVDVYEAVGGPAGLICVPDWRGQIPTPEDVAEWGQDVVSRAKQLLQK